MKYFFAVLTILSACNSKQTPVNQTTTIMQPQASTVTNVDSIPCPGEMLENPSDTIPPNLYSPKIRYNFCGWWMPEDTITPKGNFVHYLISNDDCCLDYLYLEWGNKQFRNLENLGTLRRFHPNMNPKYLGESQEYLFFESSDISGMPATGWNLWLFPLSAGNHSGVFTTISPKAFDLRSLTIVQEVLENRTDYNVIEAYNIKTKQVKHIHLKSKLSSASPAWSLDSISITPQTIFIQIWTIDTLENFFLPNDIK